MNVRNMNDKIQKRIAALTIVILFSILWFACNQTAQIPTDSNSTTNKSFISPGTKAKMDAQLKDWKTKIPEIFAKVKTQSKESPQEREALVTAEVSSRAEEFKTQFQSRMQNSSKRQPDQITSGNQIYVPDDYSTIQEAVDAAAPGDEIIVRDGDYYEDVSVVTDSLTIKSENGFGSVFLYGAIEFEGVTGGKADGLVSIGDGGYSFIGGIFVVGCSDVAVKNSAVGYGLGIIIYISSNCNAKDNIAGYNLPLDPTYFFGGITVAGSSGNLVSGNYAFANDFSGIGLIESYGNNVKNNICDDNGGYPDGSFLELYNGILDISFGTGGNNHYMNNEASGNLFCGMLLAYSDNNKIGPTNTFNENDILGLYLFESDYNVVQKNTAHDNGEVDMVDEGVGNQFINNDFGTTYP